MWIAPPEVNCKEATARKHQCRRSTFRWKTKVSLLRQTGNYWKTWFGNHKISVWWKKKQRNQQAWPGKPSKTTLKVRRGAIPGLFKMVLAALKLSFEEKDQLKINWQQRIEGRFCFRKTKLWRGVRSGRIHNKYFCEEILKRIHATNRLAALRPSTSVDKGFMESCLAINKRKQNLFQENRLLRNSLTRKDNRKEHTLG